MKAIDFFEVLIAFFVLLMVVIVLSSCETPREEIEVDSILCEIRCMDETSSLDSIDCEQMCKEL